jgi:hypothetical protein
VPSFSFLETQMRISSYITPTLDGVLGQGPVQGPEAVPIAIDKRQTRSEVGERTGVAAYFASRGARAADRFNAPRLFNDFGWNVGLDSDSESAEDEGFHLTRVGRAGSVSTISTYDRENMYGVTTDRVTVPQDWPTQDLLKCRMRKYLPYSDCESVSDWAAQIDSLGMRLKRIIFKK